ncbi:MAG: (2Fe-2S)-binding protein [Elusimicrobiales bacterium]|nr:(2Fe-2S)-binding protein [Elusimicrobiales bacterium]
MLILKRDKNGFFKIVCNINGEKKDLYVKADESLLDMLRRLGYKSVKKGCDTGDCGSCAVLVDERAVLACLVPALMAVNKKIVTVEGLGDIDSPHPIQKAFVEEGAVQCGFCIPGMIISTKYLLDKNINPSEEDIKHYLDGNLCRCSGYISQINAVKKASKLIREFYKKGVKYENKNSKNR